MSLKCGIVGSAERRQVDAFQRADQGGHRRRELSVLHDRAQRRHRRGAGPAARRAGRDRQARSASCRPSSSSSTSRASWPGASKGEGLGNQFLANIRETDAIAHVVRCFDRRQRRARRGQGRIRSRTSRRSTPNSRSPTWRRSRSSSPSTKRSRARAATRKRSASSRSLTKVHRRSLNEARPARTAGSVRGGAGRAAPVLPADDEADDVRGERRRARLPRQPAARRRRARTRRRKARRWSPCARRWRPKSPTWTATTSRRS